MTMDEKPTEENPSWFKKIRKEHKDGRILTYFPIPVWILRTMNTGFLDRFRRFARLAEKALPVIAAIGVAMLFFQVWLAGTGLMGVIHNPPPAQLAAPQNILLIPGLNQFVPLTFGVLFALLLAMVVHEFAHGVFARLYNVKVKAAGFFIAIIFPIGAFVDLDEEQLKNENWMKRVAVAGVGPYANIICGLLVFLGLLVLIGFNFPQFGLLGFLILLVIPIDQIMGHRFGVLDHLAFAYPGMGLHMYFIQFLFWFGWISLMLGLSNLIPVSPLDGGYILRAVLDRVMAAKSMKRFEKYHITPTKIAAAIMLSILAIYVAMYAWIALAGA